MVDCGGESVSQSVRAGCDGADKAWPQATIREAVKECFVCCIHYLLLGEIHTGLGVRESDLDVTESGPWRWTDWSLGQFG